VTPAALAIATRLARPVVGLSTSTSKALTVEKKKKNEAKKEFERQKHPEWLGF